MRDLDHDLPAVVLGGHEPARAERGVEPVDPLGGDEEVPGVGEELEAQHVGAQEARQQLFPHRQRFKTVLEKELCGMVSKLFLKIGKTYFFIFQNLHFFMCVFLLFLLFP